MTAAAIAALTVYDMTKALDKGIRIGAVMLLSKSGGKSGDFQRADQELQGSRQGDGEAAGIVMEGPRNSESGIRE